MTARRKTPEIVEILLSAYREGVFPMADESGEVCFYEADPRAILPLEAEPGAAGGVRVSRSLRAAVRKGRFAITSDEAFEAVIASCAAPRANTSDGGGWINEEIIGAYTLLHRAGHAHSVEAWLGTGEGRVLVGGLYGVHIGGAFFGESMFSRPDLGGTDASKVCFVHLVRHLRAIGVVLLDTQFSNPHMEQFGLIEIPKREYRKRLKAALEVNAAWRPIDVGAASGDG